MQLKQGSTKLFNESIALRRLDLLVIAWLKHHIFWRSETDELIYASSGSEKWTVNSLLLYGCNNLLFLRDKPLFFSSTLSLVIVECYDRSR